MPRPVCNDCRLEMVPEGPTVLLGYQHKHAPVDYSHARKYSCTACNYQVFLPYELGFSSAVGEPRNAIPVITPVVQQKPRLP